MVNLQGKEKIYYSGENLKEVQVFTDNAFTEVDGELYGESMIGKKLTRFKLLAGDFVVKTDKGLVIIDHQTYHADNPS